MEAAIARTGQQYTADLRTMLAELREVQEGQIAAKDETLAAKDQTIAIQAEALAAKALDLGYWRMDGQRAREQLERMQAAPTAGVLRKAVVDHERQEAESASDVAQALPADMQPAPWRRLFG